MAKKRDFASDSDVSRFISRKQNHIEVMTTKERQQVTIYPDKGVLEHVKILVKVKDLNFNSMLLALIREAMANEQYQKIIHAYLQMKEALCNLPNVSSSPCLRGWEIVSRATFINYYREIIAT